jgi:ABC transporter substrate binding protein (PQQ-dependent alcohol dehydrogenase system)
MRVLAAVVLFACALGGAAGAVDTTIVYLERRVERPPVLYNLEPPPEDAGLMGARLGVADNATTGRFLGQGFALDAVVVAPEMAFLPEAEALLAAGRRIFVVNAPAADLLALADLPAAADALILNAGAPDEALRNDDCRANVLHTLPDRAMLADALAQFLMKRRWDDWLLIAGEGPGDAAWADALRRAADKFGARVVAEKIWAFDADMRRNAAQEAPVFTQGPDYDVVVTADEIEDWARYLPYNTWLARPVAGSEGLVPAAWSPALEQWGAVQLQSRFRKLAGRAMTARDWAAWAAARAVGEAVTRSKGNEVAALRAYLLSPAFELAGFKGRPLSFRPWNGQMRQPIPLAHARAMAALAPVEGYLHARTELDTLGHDEPESSCRAFWRRAPG